MNIDVGAAWDPAHLPDSQPYDAWQKMLETAFGSWNVDSPRVASFSAHMDRHSIGGFQVVDCVCDPCGATRTRADINRDSQASMTIQLVLSGRERLTINEKKIVLTAGDLLIWNTVTPMRFEVVERLRKLSVTMPLSRLRSWLPDSWHSIDSYLPHVSPSTPLLSSAIQSISPAFLSGRLRNGEALTESLMGLLVSALAYDSDAEPTTLRETQLMMAKVYIDAHLAEPELSPAMIARARRISVRYLHALFEAEGLTVQRYIIRERLLRCRRDLQNRYMAPRTITEIAFSWGFQNATHFSRRFKAEFGMSPQEFRFEKPGCGAEDASPARITLPGSSLPNSAPKESRSSTRPDP